MKKVWIFNHYAVTPDMPGGTRHYDFAKELVKRGYSITIFASSFNYSTHKETRLNKGENYKIENFGGVNFVWIKTYPHQKNDWRRVVNMVSFMFNSYFVGKKITERSNKIKRPDIIIGSSVHLFTLLSAYWLASKYKTKFIVEIRDLWPQTLIDMGKIKNNSLTVKVLRIIEKFIYKRAKKIVVLSPNSINYLLQFGVKNENIFFVPNGVDLANYKTSGNKKKGSEFILMHTGALGLYTDLSFAIDSAKKLQDRGYKEISFIIIGDGVRKESLIRKSEKLGLSNVEFFKPVSKKEIPLLLNKADVFLLVSDNVFYGSINKLSDYMASGKPIIFSTPDKYNRVENANCGISISPKNADELVNAIVELYSMSLEERGKLGKNGRKYVEKYFNISVLVDKLEKVLN